MLEMRMPYDGNTDYIEFSYFSASCYVEEDGYLADLESKDKGKGHASALLKGVCEYADVKGRTINLIACPSSWDKNGLSRAQLVKFYRRHGFKMTECYGEGWVYMERKPTLRLEV